MFNNEVKEETLFMLLGKFAAHAFHMNSELPVSLQALLIQVIAPKYNGEVKEVVQNWIWSSPKPSAKE